MTKAENGIAFLGLGVESGQTYEGLRFSALGARDYLAKYYRLNNLGIIQSEKLYQKVFNHESFKKAFCHAEQEVEFYSRAMQSVQLGLQSSKLLVNWGGDHSIALSTVAAFLHVNPEGYIIWIDAHADLNLPEFSPTGSLHGMPLAFLLGLGGHSSNLPWVKCLDPKKVIYIGLRSIDPFESEMIERLGICSFDMQFIQKFGIETVIQEITPIIQNQKVHVSFDIDSLDPYYAPATGVPVFEGLNLLQVCSLAHSVNCLSKVKSVDIVEVNPFLGSPSEVVRTYKSAFQFLHNFISEYQYDLQLHENYNVRTQNQGEVYDVKSHKLETKVSTSSSGNFQIQTEGYF